MRAHNIFSWNAMSREIKYDENQFLQVLPEIGVGAVSSPSRGMGDKLNIKRF